MVRLFVVLGFALLAGGAYAIVDGWPYRVLERGFTEVILGGLSAVAGMILLALAAILMEIRRLKGLVSGAMAAVALSESRADARPVPNETFVRADPSLEKTPEPEAKPVGIATTLAVGAGAAAVAGALTGLAKSEDKTEEKPDEKPVGDTEEAHKAEQGDSARPDRPETVVAEPSQAPSAAAGDIDDWLLPPVSPVLDAVSPIIRPDEQAGSEEADEKAEDAQEKQESLPSTGIGAIPHPDEEKAGEAAKSAIDEPGAKQDELAATKPETAPAPDSEERLWWPRLDLPAREESSSSVDDEFNALRDQLAGVVNAPEVEPPRRDRDTPDTAESWMAPRPWPPVTQPRDPGALSEIETEAADKAPPEEAKTEPAPVADESSAPEPELAAEPALAPVDPSPAEKAEPSAPDAKAVDTKAVEAKPDEAKPDEEPAASDEGVIGAYQVGETQFTMFADGSIHARTPDGDYVFASMDELKTYLASEKDKLGA